MDVYPQRDDIIKINSYEKLPLEDGAISSIVIDLPFVVSPLDSPSVLNKKDGSNIISNRFASFYPVSDLYSQYKWWIDEAYRVLNDKGICIFKCQSTVSGGIQHWVEEYSFMCAINAGFYVKDKFIAAVDAETAAMYAQSVAESGQTSGFRDDYRYLMLAEGGNTRIIFLDCGRSLSSFRTTLLASVALSLLGLLAVLALLLILSHRIVRPMAESYEKQKQFITDAGHELKTPMTIIGADVDLAEMECGENQWLSDIRRQAQRLTGLTNDLIYLSRMEEEQPQLQWIEFPLSDMAEEMAQSFQALARSQEKELIPSIQPMLSCCGDEKSLRQLLSILLDNALKYSPSGGRLELRLERQGRRIQLTVSNTTSEPVEPEKLPHLFDRFYRSDQSRNSQTGGYGLGLSIARSIVLAHKGKIRAESRDGQSLLVIVTLPI